MGIKEAALTNMHMDKDAVKRSKEIFEKLKNVLIEENPTYREAKAAIDRLDNHLRIEMGAYISKTRINDMHPPNKD